MHALTRHRLAARGGVGGQQLVQRTETADLARAAEAPGGGAQPADVLGRVARVRQLPVEHAAQPVRPDQEVAHPVVAVHGDAGPVGRAVRGQPAHAELEGGAHLAQRIEERQGVAQRVGRRQPGDGARVDRVDGGQRVAGLRGEGASGPGPLAVAQDLARDRLALQALHHQPAGAEVVALAERDDARHRHAGRARRPQQRPLHADPAGLGADATVHLQDERARGAAGPLELEGAGDPGGATREPAQPAHGPVQLAPERGRQLVGAQPWSHPYSTGTTGLPPSSSWCRYSQIP